MWTFEQLQALWDQRPAPPRGSGTLRRIVARKGGGRHDLFAAGRLTTEAGLVGDRWSLGESPDRDRQVTLINAAVADLVAVETQAHHTGDNLHVDLDLSEEALPVGARLHIGSAVLEVTALPHLGCHKFNQRFGPGALHWVNVKALRHLRLRGINCRVVVEGEISVGDGVEVKPGINP